MTDIPLPADGDTSWSDWGDEQETLSDSTRALLARQIIAGTGLTGGGDLSADRTLAVSYGSASGTSVQGNDARVTADQAAGTASIRTIGTGALQAKAGNYQPTAANISDSTTTGRAVLTAADAAAARTAIGAGTYTSAAASETAQGIVELATAAETTTGTDNTRAVHPAGLKVELDKKSNLLTTQSTQTGTTYTFVLADAGTLVEGNNASAQTYTVPPNSSVAFPVGTSIVVRQYGAGQITLAAGAGVTLRSRGAALKLAGQYAELTATKRATDEWVISGDVTV